MISEDIEDFMCAAVTVFFRECKLVRLLYRNIFDAIGEFMALRFTMSGPLLAAKHMRILPMT
jgi:hypothetical protein